MKIIKKKLIVTNIQIVNNNNIVLTGYYENESKHNTKIIEYGGTLEDVYDEIQRNTIHIQEKANEYKWTFILMLMKEKFKGMIYNHDEMKKHFNTQGKQLKINNDNYIINITLTNNDNTYIKDTNKTTFKHTKQLIEAKQYKLFEAAVKAMKLKQCNEIKHTKIIKTM